MSVTYVQVSTTGLVPNTTGLGIGTTQQSPSIVYITTNDTLAEVLVTGYLNLSRADFQIAYNNYQMALVFTIDQGNVWLRVLVSGSNYSLESTAEAGLVALPTVANQIVYATNTSGGLAASGVATALFNAGNISAGLSGTAGALYSFPSTATTGKLGLVAVANSANFTVNISNVLYGQSSTISFADVGSAAGRFLVANTATPFTTAHLIASSGTGGLTADSGIATANVQLISNFKGAITATYAGGGTSNAFTATGLTATSIVTAVIVTSSNAVAIAKAVPTSNTLTVTFTADPGAGTTVAWLALAATQ